MRSRLIPILVASTLAMPSLAMPSTVAHAGAGEGYKCHYQPWKCDRYAQRRAAKRKIEEREAQNNRFNQNLDSAAEQHKKASKALEGL